MSFLKNLKPHNVVADVFNYKYVIAGRPKAGKTSLIYGITKEKYDGDLSKLLLVAFEKGYNALDGIYAHDIEEWTDFQELVDELIENKDDIPFRILGFDTVDVMAKLATDYVIRTQSRRDGKRYLAINDLAYGKGYELLDREMSEQITKLDNAGFSLFFLTHDKDRQFETREGLKYDKTTLSLGGRVRDLVLNMADFIVFIELSKELVDGVAEDKRYIYFRGDSGLEAGTRFKHVPNRIEYSYKGFVDTVEDAILEEYGGDKDAVKDAKKKQNEEKESKARKYVEKIKGAKSAKELHDEINDIVLKLEDTDKRAIAREFAELLGSPNFKANENVELLEKALEIANTYIE